VDEGTLLVGLAGPAAAVVGEGGGAPSAPSLGPRALMAWTEGVYGPVFGGVGPFALRENGEGRRRQREKTVKERACFACFVLFSFLYILFLCPLSPFHPPPRRLRLWRPQVRGQRPGHLQGAVGAPHVEF